MDAALLTNDEFWNDPTPFAAGTIPDDPALISHVLFETSGSSGKPKWVALSKAALLASAAAVNQHLGVTHESRWGLALPLNHVGGFGILARTYQAKCELSVYDSRWDATLFSAWLETHGITHTSLVPTQVHDLVKARCMAPPSIKAIVVGGGHLDAEAGQAARDLGWPVLASYGMTESATQIATQRIELLGKPYQPFPIPLLPIWNATADDAGVLTISGPALFSGYVIDGIFHPRTNPTHRTSDRAVVEDDNLTPLGRVDSLVKILGELVDPEAIEREVISLSGGAISQESFAVVVIPDKRAGNALIPVFESDRMTNQAVEFLSEYSRTVPGFRRLRPAETVDIFPRSGLGKLLRKDLTNTILANRVQSWKNPL